jgi:hypothetical protein
MADKDPLSTGITPGGGSDRSWFESLDLDGNTQTYDDSFDAEIHNLRTIGCHKGNMAGLNVINAEPGYHYQWVRESPSDDRSARIRGLTPVTTDGDTNAASSLQAGSRSSPDSLVRYNELVLYRMPMHKYREYQQGLDEQSERQFRGGDARFAQGATAREQAASPRGPSRFARRDHRVEVRDGMHDESRIQQQWTPNRGTIEEG